MYLIFNIGSFLQRTHVNLMDLIKSFPTLLAKIGFDTAENESLTVFQKVVRLLDILS